MVERFPPPIMVIGASPVSPVPLGACFYLGRQRREVPRGPFSPLCKKWETSFQILAARWGVRWDPLRRRVQGNSALRRGLIGHLFERGTAGHERPLPKFCLYFGQTEKGQPSLATTGNTHRLS